MQHTTLNLKRDGHEYFTQIWKPSQVKAVVLIVHGQSDHSSRYLHVADHFTQEGIGVVSFDLYGHGKSVGKRGHVPSFEVFLDSVDEALSYTRKEFPGMVPFLYGHSMGGTIAASMVLRRHPDLKGVILSAPWLRLAFEPSKFQLWLANTVKGILPSLTQPAKLDSNGLSRDTAVAKAYDDDPLVHGMISPTEFLSAVEQGEWLIANSQDWSYPLLHFHGTADPVTSIEASKEFFNNISQEGKDLTFKEWEDFRHECHNELGKEEVLTFVANWIKERL